MATSASLITHAICDMMSNARKVAVVKEGGGGRRRKDPGRRVVKARADEGEK
jgi:hypothetical protein